MPAHAEALGMALPYVQLGQPPRNGLCGGLFSVFEVVDIPRVPNWADRLVDEAHPKATLFVHV